MNYKTKGVIDMLKRNNINMFRGGVERKAALYKRFARSYYARKNYAFTLAEVLITLGIIGVVAAMVIPTLISNIQGAVFRSKFKKAVAVLNQAVKMNKANYGWDFADISGGDFDINDNPEIKRSRYALFNGSLQGLSVFDEAPSYVSSDSGNLRHVAAAAGVNYYDRDGGAIQTLDGMTVAFVRFYSWGCHKEAGQSTLEFVKGYYNSSCIAYIDVNGEAGPNRETVCDGTSQASGNWSGSNAIGWVTLDASVPCKVTSKTIGDQFPVLFHDDVVEPASNAAAAVLGSTK